VLFLGSLVQVADTRTLFEYGCVGAAVVRLEPAQFLCAGRTATVVGARRRGHDFWVYVLEDLPGLWPEECLQEVRLR
jgi:hypothetical protein